MHHVGDTSGCAVIFVSHQWISLQHPDPQGKQLTALQEALIRLLSGEEIRSSSAIQKPATRTSWPKVLSNARIWYDYFSIPQTSYDSNCGDELLCAVRSIPAYVELSAYTFILAPPMEHHDLVEASTGAPVTCDYFSWLERGWCLLEKMAQFLKVNPKPVVVIRSGSLMQYQDHLETMTRKVGEARFTCCAMDHKMQQDGSEETVACDKVKVRQLMILLIERRLRHEERRENYGIYRLLRSLRTYFLTNLPHPEGYDPWEGERTLDDFLVAYNFSRADVTNVRLKGWTPLRFAALSGNAKVVKELIELNADVNAPFSKNNPLWVVIKGCNILCQTAIFCSGPEWQDCMTLLLEAGADATCRSIDVLNCACLSPKPQSIQVGGVMVSLRNWGAEWVLDHIPANRFDINATVSSANFEQTSCLLSACAHSGDIAFLELLVKYGADFATRMPATQRDAFFLACARSSDTTLLEYCYNKLVKSGKPIDINRRLKLRFPLCPSNSRVKRGHCYRGVQRKLHWRHGATAMLVAAMEGKADVVTWLLGKGADPTIANAAGETPYSAAVRFGYCNVVDALKCGNKC